VSGRSTGRGSSAGAAASAAGTSVSSRSDGDSRSTKDAAGLGSPTRADKSVQADTPARAADTAVRPDRPATGTGHLAEQRKSMFPVAPPVNRVRRARLKIANIDPWSVMKVSFLFSVAIAMMGLVAVTLLWSLLDMMGVFSTVGSTVDDVTGGPASGGFDVQAFFSLSRVLGFTTIIALVDIVLLTALATVGAYLYNVTTDFVGGIEITLADEE